MNSHFPVWSVYNISLQRVRWYCNLFRVGPDVAHNSVSLGLGGKG